MHPRARRRGLPRRRLALRGDGRLDASASRAGASGSSTRSTARRSSSSTSPSSASASRSSSDGRPIVGGRVQPREPTGSTPRCAAAGTTVQRRAAHVSSTTSRVADAVVLASRSEDKRGEWDPFKDRVHVMLTGSVAFKLAELATGDGDATFTLTPKNEWDICAGSLLVEEAGGRVTGPRRQAARLQPAVDAPAGHDRVERRAARRAARADRRGRRALTRTLTSRRRPRRRSDGRSPAAGKSVMRASTPRSRRRSISGYVVDRPHVDLEPERVRGRDRLGGHDGDVAEGRRHLEGDRRAAVAGEATVTQPEDEVRRPRPPRSWSARRAPRRGCGP